MCLCGYHVHIIDNKEFKIINMGLTAMTKLSC